MLKGRIMVTRANTKIYGAQHAAEVLEKIRKYLDISICEMARRTESGQSNLSEVLKGQGRISLDKAIKMARLLGVGHKSLVGAVLQDALEAAGSDLKVMLLTAEQYEIYLASKPTKQ